MSDFWDEVLDDDVVDVDVVPVGKYNAKVVYAEGVNAQTSGAQMVKVKFEVIEGPYKGGEVWTNIVLSTSTKSRKWWLRKLDALGLSRAWLAEHRPTKEQIAAVLKDTEPVAEIELVPSNDPEYPNPDLRNIRKVGGPGAAANATAPSAPKPAAPSVPQPGSGPPKPNIPTTPDTPPVPTVPADTADTANEEPF